MFFAYEYFLSFFLEKLYKFILPLIMICDIMRL